MKKQSQQRHNDQANKSAANSFNIEIPKEALSRLLEIQPDILAIGPEKSLTDVLTTIAEVANSLLGGNLCIVFPYDHANDRFLLEQVRTGGDPKARHFPWGEPRPIGASRTILLYGKLIIENYGDPKYFGKYPFLKERVAKGERRGAYQDITPVKATLGIRLQSGDEPLGILVVNYPEPHKFQEAELDIAHIFASQAAIAIRNARLFDEQTRLANYNEQINRALQGIQEKVLSGFYDVLSGFYDIETASKEILSQAQKLLSAETGQILLLDSENNLVIKASTNPIEANLFRVSLENSVSGIAIQQAKPINVTDISSEEPYKSHYKKFLGSDMHSELVVPLRIGEKIMGVINVESPRIGAFTKRHEEILSVLAGQAAMAFRVAEELEIRKRAAEADKMLAAGQIVHRLTGRSGAIRRWIEIIKEEQPELIRNNETFAIAVNDIDRKAEELLALVNELKQRTADPLQTVEIPFLIDVALGKLQKTDEYQEMNGRIHIEKDILQNLPKVKGDVTLAEVFLNLLSNSVNAMPEGGTIVIRTEADADRVKVSVKDNGPGIPQELHKVIFSGKFSGSSELGHGLGLWWSRTYVRALGGNILLESEAGAGACFTVELPSAS